MLTTALIVDAVLSSTTGMAGSDEADLSRLADQYEAIRRAAQQEDWKWLDPQRSIDRYHDQAQDLMDHAQQSPIAEMIAEDNLLKHGKRYYIFVSSSLGEAALKEIMGDASAMLAKGERVALVLRGLIPGDENMLGTQQYIHRLILESNFEPMPIVHIDPNVFSDFSISSVPTIVLVDGKTPLASASGVSLTYFAEKNSAKPKGEMGTLGPVEKIVERDMLELIQERLAKLDVEAMKKKAIDNAWQHQRFQELPVATKNKERIVSAEVMVNQNLVADGQVFAYAGDVINQLELLPFKSRIIVFDGLDAKQTKKAIALSQKQSDYEDVILLTTRVDKSDGWDSFNGIQGQFSQPIYLLNDAITTRFDLQAVPCEIRADNENKRFIVTEYIP